MVPLFLWALEAAQRGGRAHSLSDCRSGQEVSDAAGFHLPEYCQVLEDIEVLGKHHQYRSGAGIDHDEAAFPAFHDDALRPGAVIPGKRRVSGPGQGGADGPKPLRWLSFSRAGAMTIPSRPRRMASITAGNCFSSWTIFSTLAALSFNHINGIAHD